MSVFLLLAAALDAFEKAAGPGIHQAQAVSPVAPAAKTGPGQVFWPQACSINGSRQECFGAIDVAGPYYSVGSFFNRRGNSSEDHFLLKLWLPDTPGRYQINGGGFYVSSSPGSFDVFKFGVFVTEADAPVFPNIDQLLDLQRVSIQAEGQGTETCVNFPAGTAILESGQAAWLVLQFPNTFGNQSLGVLAETDNVDEDCDFFTPDLGETWYRPSPHSSINPVIDFAISVYAETLPSKEEILDELIAEEDKTWSIIKRIYR